MIRIEDGAATVSSRSDHRLQSPIAPDPEDDAGRSVEDWIGDHPIVSIAAALVVGAALGWIIKRT